MKHVTFHLPSFLRRVRIHGGEFDSSARAMNRADQVRLLQAEPRIVRGSTIERKQMSTKTTFKRVALVAVAALGFGLLSVAPSSAAANTLLTYKSGDGAPSGDLNTGAGVAGAFNYVTVEADTWSATAANDYIITTDSTFGTVSSGTLSADKKSLVANSLDNQIQVMTPTVGTVTVSYWKRTAGVLAAAPAETVVITVNAAAQSGTFSVANSTAFIVAGETNTAVAPTADAVVSAVSTANIETAVASIQIALKDALKATFADTITATVISGGANVKAFAITDSTTAVTTNVTAGTFADSAYSSTGKVVIGVFANGTAGPAVIRLTSSAGTEIAQKTVTFSSTTVATLEATVVTKYVSSAGKAGAITVVAKDSAGNVINGAVITATSGTTTAIASPSSATTADGKASFTVAAASATAAGASVITFKSGVATTTASITAAGVLATVLTITPSADTANAGDKITFTMTVADANGPLADGDYVAKFVSAPVTSSGTTGAFATDTITVKDGVATSEIFLPFVAGNYTSTWTLKGTAGTATADLSAALAGSKITSTVVVANPGVDAATDAANDAFDAANEATDAALAAAEAADAATSAAQEATDAVAALSESVTKLIAGLQAQIKSLAAVVAKIAKKVKA